MKLKLSLPPWIKYSFQESDVANHYLVVMHGQGILIRQSSSTSVKSMTILAAGPVRSIYSFCTRVPLQVLLRPLAGRSYLDLLTHQSDEAFSKV